LLAHGRDSGGGGGESELGEVLGNGFELQEGREHDVHVGFAACRLMDLGYCLGGENGHGN